jgi:hypothetical protein
VMEYFDRLSLVVLVCVKHLRCEIMAWCEVCCVAGERTGVLAWADMRGLCIEYLGLCYV